MFSFTFFSLPLIFTLHWWPVAILLLSPPLQNFHVVLPTKNCLLCFLSFALDLCRPFLVELRWSAAYTFVFVDYITSSCIWVAIPVELFYIGMPVVRTDGRLVGVRSHDFRGQIDFLTQGASQRAIESSAISLQCVS